MNDLLKPSSFGAASFGTASFRRLMKREQDLDDGMGRAYGGSDPPRDVEMGEVPDPADAQKMAEFEKDIKEIDGAMGVIESLLKRLKDDQEESRLATSSAQVKVIMERMNQRVNEVSHKAKYVKARLEALSGQNESVIRGGGPIYATDRIRAIRTGDKVRKFKDLMEKFNGVREDIRNEQKDNLSRRVFTVTGQKPSEEEVERMIDSGESEEIFKKAIQEQGRAQIMSTVAEIQERYEDAKDLVRSLGDLQQIFLDLAVLVEEQGGILTSIEKHVSEAGEYVQHGTKQLQAAKETQKSTRKWMCYAIIIMLVIIAIILTSVLASTRSA
eukprot:TRINITY_DN5957_c0_g1_i2.p1 TRINITY_DN5957_c0_g1~~TRINITY_DN5957_c0_g1_i2.p1  ORF type:complete len:328 (-),score=70.96 TRINITY_DN5957_c0_g1_i2:898-1881(-)